jgi:glycosyltransferase involved in cell wall biosynthesis
MTIATPPDRDTWSTTRAVAVNARVGREVDGPAGGVAQCTLRVGIDGDTLGRKRTGDESYLASLIRSLGQIDSRNRYSVFVRDAAQVARQFPDLAGWQFRQVRPASIWLRHPIGFPWALRRAGLDVLHTQYFVPPLCPCPVVVTVHDISYAVRPEYFTWRDRVLLGALVPRALARAQRVITDTEYTRRDLVQVYGVEPGRIAVIPLAADPRYCVLDREACRAEVAQRHRAGAGFILYVGTLQPRKNVTTLIEAYAQFRRRTGLPHKLLIVGKPKYKYEAIFTALQRSGYAQDVIWAGFVPDGELPRYYCAAEVFVFPSLYEGFGLPVLEAMACGTPVISSSAACLPEVVGDGGILADPRLPHEFAGALERVLGDAKYAEQLRARGLRRAAQFTWEQTARATLAVYEEVAQAGRS